MKKCIRMETTVLKLSFGEVDSFMAAKLYFTAPLTKFLTIILTMHSPNDI